MHKLINEEDYQRQGEQQRSAPRPGDEKLASMGFSDLQFDLHRSAATRWEALPALLWVAANTGRGIAKSAAASQDIKTSA